MAMSDNARAWYNHALTTGDDSFARFMMHWIAFNFEYGQFRRRKPDGKWNSERERIELLCRSKYDDLCGYDPFTENPAEVNELIEFPVLNGRRAPDEEEEPHLPPNSRKPHEMWPEELWGVVCLDDCPGRYHGIRRTQCLLLTLYQVRCNLFHGSKSPEFVRDMVLVKDAAIIMQRYMEALLNIDTSSQQLAD